jgi:Rod binding domain-containing protein
MDSTRLILTGPVLPPVPLEHLSGTLFSGPVPEGRPDKIKGLSEERKEQVAKDFESVLLSKLLDEMKNTVVDWSFEEDGVSEQIHGIFWLYLARHLADNGGLGLWKDIYQFLTDAADMNTAPKALDKNI